MIPVSHKEGFIYASAGLRLLFVFGIVQASIRVGFARNSHGDYTWFDDV
jgi:hypothetical protein